MQFCHEHNDHRLRRWMRGVFFFLLRLLYFLRGIVFYSFGRERIQTPKIAMEAFKQIDSLLFHTFNDKTLGAMERYYFLFRYFVTGILLYRSDKPSLAYYPGAPSKRGPHKDNMEGFTRMLPLICSWVSSGREKVVETLNGGTVDLEEVVAKGLIAGTDPDSPGYWGNILHRDPRICEAADVALSIWMIRNNLWSNLSSREKRKIFLWLLSVNGKDVYDNNWHLFPVMINVIASSLGYQDDKVEGQAHYSRFKSFYRGDGWFSDGPNNVYDYYNAWGMHYSLFWLNQISAEFDPEFIKSTLNHFLKNYIFFLTPEGLPMLGRSICYRMAASAPMIAGYLQDPSMIAAGLAQRALDAIWTYFISKGAVNQGRIAQGYFGDDLRLLDNYSGPASCLWGLRSLVLAFYCPKDSPFWTTPASPLPVEVSDYCITIPSIGWKVKGIKETQEVIIETGKIEKKRGAIKNYTWFHKTAGFLAGRPFRPRNNFVKYNLSRYSSKELFREPPR
ncbi:MAG: DUF2264 domain-containing protein [Thermodesulfobacteriota bacterium]|nr:DUF2264 domain-containing protein [Thermodesulfobacteriota bacterium]